MSDGVPGTLKGRRDASTRGMGWSLDQAGWFDFRNPGPFSALCYARLPWPRILCLEDVMFGRVAALVYGIASYLVFFVATVYAVAFIGNYPVPKTIDTGPESGLAGTILI